VSFKPSFFNPSIFNPTFFNPSFVGELLDAPVQFLGILRLTLVVKHLANKQRAIHEHKQLDHVELSRFPASDLGPMTAWFREAAQHPHRWGGSDCWAFGRLL